MCAHTHALEQESTRVHTPAYTGNAHAITNACIGASCVSSSISFSFSGPAYSLYIETRSLSRYHFPPLNRRTYFPSSHSSVPLFTLKFTFPGPSYCFKKAFLHPLLRIIVRPFHFNSFNFHIDALYIHQIAFRR